MTPPIYKYPRTRHIEGSRLQSGDEDLKTVPFQKIKGGYLVIEEKMDGANAAISFSDEGKLLIQSRGHYLTGGYRERHFNLLKSWAAAHTMALKSLLGNRFILYGEWLYAKHTLYYDALSHYFMEFDILDRRSMRFLSTRKRRKMLAGAPFIVSVRVLKEGKVETLEALKALIGKSAFITDAFRENLVRVAESKELMVEKILRETNLTETMEGLYIKVEDEDTVKERFKYVRDDFLTTIQDSETHWMDRPIIPNRLKDQDILFSSPLNRLNPKRFA